MYKAYPYFGRKNEGKYKKNQNRDKTLNISLVFVLYPVMMVGNN